VVIAVSRSAQPFLTRLLVCPLSMQTQSNRLQYFLLGLLVLGSMLFFLASTAAIFDSLIHYADRARPPLEFSEAPSSMAKPLGEALAAGIQPADNILAINGVPFTGMAGLIRQIHGAHAGDLVTVVDRSPAGKLRTVRVRLEKWLLGSPTPSRWLIAIVVHTLFPAFCLLLGYWVVFAKPRDRNAWFFLGIMNVVPVSFGTSGYFPGFLASFTILWQEIVINGMFICLILLGIYFPVRSRLDTRHPWIKWLLIVPLFLLIVSWVFLRYGMLYDVRFIQPYLATLRPLHITENVFVVLSFVVFLASILRKLFTVQDPDARRRLGVVAAGSILGLTPGLIIIIVSTLTGVPFSEAAPPWAILVAVTLFSLFPLSLAYTVIVQRALDVRIFLRQGTRYAFARGTLWVLQAAFFSYLGYSLYHFSRESHHRPGHLVFPIAIVLLLTFLRFPVMRSLSLWVDRRFFREAYSVEQVLNELSQQARGFAETEPLVRTIIDRISETLHVESIAVLLRQGPIFRMQYAQGLAAADGVALSENSSTIRTLVRGDGPARIRRDRPDPWLSLASPSEVQTLDQLRAELMLPLPGRSELIGVMALGPKRSEEPYSSADRRLLQSVALQTGLAIENTELVRTLAEEASHRERLNNEIEIAKEVQQHLFPQLYPKVEGVELAGFCRTAQQIGGDYYDFIPLENGRLGIAIGDVSGKGISAALMMASIRSALHGLTYSGILDLPVLMQSMNHIAYESSADNRFTTFFFAEYDPATRRLDYVNAGHDAPILLRAASAKLDENCNPPCICDVLKLDLGGPVLGVFPELAYQQGSLELKIGDVLIAYTDGLSEAINAHYEEWGIERILQAAQESAQLPAREIVSKLLQGADQFTAGEPQNDDLTMIVVKIIECSPSAPLVSHAAGSEIPSPKPHSTLTAIPASR
jgi:phosphoserine phosphatase RsbU/P